MDDATPTRDFSQMESYPMNVISLGTFDLPHYGHMNLISHCRDIAGDGLVVIAVNTDEFVERFKNKRPIMTLEERLKFFVHLSDVDYVIPNVGEEYAEKTIEVAEREIQSTIDLIVIGSDWHSRDYLGQLHTDWDYLGDKGIGVCYFKYSDGISSTEIKSRL